MQPLLINANETRVKRLPGKPPRLEDTDLQEINCYFISWNRNSTLDENVKTDLRAITMHDLVAAVERSVSSATLSRHDHAQNY